MTIITMKSPVRLPTKSSSHRFLLVLPITRVVATTGLAPLISLEPRCQAVRPRPTHLTPLHPNILHRPITAFPFTAFGNGSPIRPGRGVRTTPPVPVSLGWPGRASVPGDPWRVEPSSANWTPLALGDETPMARPGESMLGACLRGGPVGAPFVASGSYGSMARSP